MLTALKAQLRRWLNRYAPPMSRRRRLLWRSKWVLVNCMRPMRVYRELRYGNIPWDIENPYDLDLLDGFLIRAGLTKLSSPTAVPGTDPNQTIRWILQQLLRRPEIRREIAQPLSGNADGLFCRWLCEEATRNVNAIPTIQSIFDKPPSNRLMSMWDEYSNWREVFPLAMTPAGRGRFLHYLLVGAKPFWNLSVEEILWFHLKNAEDPYQGLVSSYLRQPAWQEAHPAALTPEGWLPFINWLRSTYSIEGDWLDSIDVPKLEPKQEHLLNRVARVQLHPESAKTDRPFGVNVQAHFRYPSGLQEAALNTVHALELSQVPHTKRDIPNSHLFDLPDRTGYLDQELFDISISCIPPEPLGEQRFAHAGLYKRPDLYRIAIWYWELEHVLPGWANAAVNFDEIWAPTKFICDAFAKVMKVPVRHMAPGIRFPKPTNYTRASFDLPGDKFIFLFMFDMLSIFERKNPLAVIQAYQNAFGKSKDTQLVIKLSRGDKDQYNLNRLMQACDRAGVQVIDRVMSRDESYGLLEQCDCYVSLHRSEGYGLTMAEAMSYRKPVIATGYSGNLDFMDATNSRLVPFELKKLGRDYFPYPKEAIWAEPSIEAAAREMRWVVDHPGEAEKMAEKGEHDIRQLLSLEAYGNRLRERLEAIHQASR